MSGNTDINIKMLEKRISELEKQVAYLLERERREQEAEQGMVDMLEGRVNKQ